MAQPNPVDPVEIVQLTIRGIVEYDLGDGALETKVDDYVIKAYRAARAEDKIPRRLVWDATGAARTYLRALGVIVRFGKGETRRYRTSAAILQAKEDAEGGLE